ncbi:DUF3800 domain-containing protein [Pseudooctadecabacter jejudonensis]|uniref:DUF3800 domain-containing protein n=1 Tax=Pseudooctadecabacter jejudonensis TaxID=1391910 RepID=A0A1Y5SIL2_9RHOB|nr:DUF3800 domain-containing protein [Pseudooctadecabacter jejudonensis]SLN41676.1 hypothetical protein PSJ8397_02099 [Pseudooctadecabacter jejudonensis]
MKFVYVDETGDQVQSDTFVMTAVEIDAIRLNKYSRIFSTMIGEVFAKHPGKPQDLKTRRFHRGAGGWNKISGEDRKAFLNAVVEEIANSSKIYASAISFKKFKATDHKAFGYPDVSHSYWIANAMFVLSHVQREHCDDPKNKGNCVIVVDDNKVEHANMAELIFKPDPWFDDLAFKAAFLKSKKRPKNWETKRFNQIVNTPFAIKSEHASTILVADLAAFVLRRYIELKTEDEAFIGEKVFFDALFAKLKPVIKTHKNLHKKTQAYEYYRALQPEVWDFAL